MSRNDDLTGAVGQTDQLNETRRPEFDTYTPA